MAAAAGRRGKRRRAAGGSAKPNPPQLLLFGANPGGRRTWTRGGVKIGKEVDRIYYVHVTEGPRVHEFEHNGVKLEGLPDGSLRIFHPDLRLWEDQ